MSTAADLRRRMRITAGTVIAFAVILPFGWVVLGVERLVAALRHDEITGLSTADVTRARAILAPEVALLSPDAPDPGDPDGCGLLGDVA